MTQVVFLMGPYFPNFSAVSFCAYRVIQCLSDELNVSVVSIRDSRRQTIEEVHEGIRIWRIETAGMRKRNYINSLQGLTAKIGLDILRTKGAIQRLFSSETIDKALVKAYLNQLHKMPCRPSIIVPTVFPFETVLAALEYKKNYPDTLVVPYIFDDFVESGSLHVFKFAGRLKKKRHLELERMVLTEANAILAMHPMRAHLEAHFDKSLTKKITFLEHPLLSRVERQLRPDKHVTSLCYTGSMIRKVREPTYLLDVLKAVKATFPLRADFYVMGNAAQKIPSMTLKNGVVIANHGHVPKSEADAAVSNASILLNIGEAQGKQVSSKVFEYMSYGKPIIHFAYTANDAVSKILARYPLALCLMQDYRRLRENSLLVSEFIQKNRSNVLTYEEVESLFPEAMPETTAVLLRALVTAEK